MIIHVPCSCLNLVFAFTSFTHACSLTLVWSQCIVMRSQCRILATFLCQALPLSFIPQFLPIYTCIASSYSNLAHVHARWTRSHAILCLPPAHCAAYCMYYVNNCPSLKYTSTSLTPCFFYFLSVINNYHKEYSLDPVFIIIEYLNMDTAMYMCMYTFRWPSWTPS